MPDKLLISDPAHWHSRAAEARRAAEELEDGSRKKALLSIADFFEQIASRAGAIQKS